MKFQRTPDERSLYFQTIARDFFERRGAPFYLSSRDIAQIEEWEKAGIPLRIVREGIASTFSLSQGGKKSRGKIQSLMFCALSVQKAFAMYKERTVGRERKMVSSAETKSSIGRAVDQFLKKVPPQVGWLEGPFRRVLEELSGSSDEDLEKMEEEVESLLLSKAGREDVEAAHMAAASEFPSFGPDETGELRRITLIKHMRGKYKIPHIAPFYY